MKTPQEITNFLTLSNLELNEFNSNNSIKSNFSIGTNNFKALNLYLSKTLSFIKNIYETIDIQSIVSSVLQSLEQSKNVLDINVTLNIGTSITQQIGSKIYRIERVDDFKIIITGDNIINWNVDNIICQVKDNNGMVVYPVIVTSNNKIEIFFNDMIGSNYKLYWI